MNKVILIGNLTKDPELTTTPNGINVCKFSIAVQRRFNNSDGEKEADFFNIIAWRGIGENAHKFLKKGNKACVVGCIQIRQYDSSDGIKKIAVDIIADDIEFLTPKSSGKEESEEDSKAVKKKSKAKSISELEPAGDDGSLPF